MVSTITKEAWDAITTIRINDDHVKKATVQQLCQKFDLATFDDGESVEDYALHQSGMVAYLTTHDKEVKDNEIIVKMLRCLSPRFKQITIAIKTLLNVSTMCITDLTWQLKEVKEAFEEASTALQQDGKVYLIKEQDTWKKKREVESHSSGVGKGGRRGRGYGHGNSSSGGSSNKPTRDECRCCSNMGTRVPLEAQEGTGTSRVGRG
jgi:hypothetical protein